MDFIVSKISKIGEEMASLVPSTPDINGECRDLLSDLNSPLTQPLKSDHLDSAMDMAGDDGSPRTPKDYVFNPFAPAADDLLLAPHCKKRCDEWRTSVTRRLNFGCPTENPGKRSHEENQTHISDKELMDALYENLLEIILESKTEDIFAEMSSIEWADEDCRTPTSVPKLNGFAETCPGAPVKAAANSRNIKLSFYRKLQF
ncbi:hypothetical protein SAY87_014740 [Trapa incisa]|uniref:Uncharacterized protein n=2 Tax=Trapa TaxID=22665 RepID=A0AAN7RNI7_TRANT|nr:hypothetical protein SAY87_014740 [Trapa incisa]KAK4802848.1 hypothetical protein SAY86_001051 [Trapa natans]